MADDKTTLVTGGTGDHGDKSTPENPFANIINTDGTFAQNWRDLLPEEDRDEKCLDVVSDFPGAIKQLIHAQRALGGDKIAVPGEDSPDEVWNRAYDALGRPSTAADYNVTIPEELNGIFTPERMAAAKELAHKLGISQKQFNGYMAYEFEQAEKLAADQDKYEGEQKDRAEQILRERFGGAYDERLHIANLLIAETLEGEKKLEFLEKYGNDPDFIEFASTIGARLVESKAMVARMTTDTPGDAKQKIKELEATPGYLLPGELTPQEERRITEELSKLYKIAYPDEAERIAARG